jgi:hypothetical protein
MRGMLLPSLTVRATREDFAFALPGNRYIPPFIHASKRYRLFFDETGNGDLHAAKKDQNQRYLSLTGIVVRQDLHVRWRKPTPRRARCRS